ncbi:MAG: mannose-1-phosphate guanylyltransferase [Ignavibacterium sp.]
MELFAVIMAGGIGSRFWPRSREKSPKQLLQIFGENTMIQDTIARLKGLVKDENIFIITNKAQRNEILKQINHIPEKNIIAEPFGKNTAACIGLASILIEKINPEAVTIILPSDHIIKNINEYQQTLRNAAEFAYKSKGLITIGIQPTRPETGYGYIQIDDKLVEDNIYKVYAFAEKPNYATAVRFIESGDFLWNSGMFIWRVDSILKEIKAYLHELYSGLEHLKQFIGTDDFEKELIDVYGQFRSISIDYGIMEKSQNVYLTVGDFSWNDVGSWDEVYKLSEKDDNGNALTGEVYTEYTNDCYVFSPNKFTAVIGIENCVIINTDDALLVCRRDLAQEVKKVVDHLKHNRLNEYL